MSLRQHFIYRKEVTKTTWKLRIALGLVVAVFLASTGRFWLVTLAQSLVHEDRPRPVEVILIEDFAHTYLLYETAARLARQGYGRHVWVQAPVSTGSDSPNRVDQGQVDLMASVARIPSIEVVGVHMSEPIAYNVGLQVKEQLERRGITSLMVVTRRFRSRRTYAIYSQLLAPLGVELRCVPVAGERTPQDWWETWHGIQEVLLEFAKLQYYRFAVL